MKKSSITVLSALGALALAASCSRVERTPPAQPAMPATSAEGTKLLSGLPVGFVPNLGQWEHPARFVARVGAMTVFLEEKGWSFTAAERTAEEGEDAPVSGVAVRMTFAGASEPALVVEDRLPGHHHYFLGNDASKWRSDVPLYASVRYRDVHPGVDVRAREHDGRFEYDLLLKPDADLEPVEIAVEGVEKMYLDRDGALVMQTQLGPVRMPAPLSWEEGPSGERSPILVGYVLRGEKRFGFEAPLRQPGWRMVVDPGLVWSTFLGTSDSVRAIGLNADGSVTVAGRTDSATFPITAGAFDTSYNGGNDVFVTRLSPAGSSLVSSTFLGGTGMDQARQLAVDASGEATIAGYTRSSDFPTTAGAFDRSYNGGIEDAFVTRLSATGSSLVWSTFLGGTADDSANGIALDPQGVVTVTGPTGSTDFPTTAGAFERTMRGVNDAFVARLSATGSSLVWSTFLGGAGGEYATAVAVDPQGVVTVTGDTGSTDFPTTPGAYDRTYNGNGDPFVTRLSPTGASLVYSTFLGGTANDRAISLAVDPQGAAVVVGATSSADFPTTPGAYDRTYGGNGDPFVTRLSPTGVSLDYSTFLGGAALDEAMAVAVDPQGAVIAAGWTASADFPTTPGAFDRSYNGGMDAFVTRLAPTGASLIYSTFLGGAGPDGGDWCGLALDAEGTATLATTTASAGFPVTPGAYRTSRSGPVDACVTRLDMLPTGVAAFGRSSLGCTGPLAIGVTSMPSIGNASFALTCGNAPPSAPGFVPLAGAGLGAPVRVLGIDLWLDPLALWLIAPTVSDARGAVTFPLAVPQDQGLVGLRLTAQFLWLGPTSPPPCPPQGFSASNALGITIQSPGG